MEKINCRNVIIVSIIAVILIFIFVIPRTEGFSTCQLSSDYCNHMSDVYLELPNEEHKLNRYTEQEDAVKYNSFDDLYQ